VATLSWAVACVPCCTKSASQGWWARRRAKPGQRLSERNPYRRFTGPKIAEAAIQKGWADQAELDGIARAFGDWGENPDAFMEITGGEGVWWKKRT